MLISTQPEGLSQRKLTLHKFPVASDRQTRDVQTASGSTLLVTCAGKTLDIQAYDDSVGDREKDISTHTLPKSSAKLACSESRLLLELLMVFETTVSKSACTTRRMTLLKDG